MKFTKIFELIIAIGFWLGCASTTDIQQSSPTSTYTKNSFKPLYYLYHQDESTSVLYFKINPSEVLFTRANPNSSFESHINFEILMYETTEDKSVLVDTLKVVKKYTNIPNQTINIEGEINLPLQGNRDYFLKVNCLDVNKKNNNVQTIFAPKTNRNHRMNFLVLDDSTHQPIFDYQKIGAGSVTIENNRNQDKSSSIFEIDLSEVKFPPPPFASRLVFLPDLPEVPVETTFFEENYAYFITTDSTFKDGITIAVRDPFYPEVKTFEQMAKPLRYITTKSEYEELVSGNHTKKTLDDFWIKCGGSTERGEQLIRIYYNRVATTNKYFSTINPGWKTDRGEIYLVYGKPNVLQRRKNEETWIYGDITNPNSLSFTFVKKENIYSDNQYELIRNSGYRIHWQRAVTNWINGRVYERK